MVITEAEPQSSNHLFNYDAGRAGYLVEPFLLSTLDLTNVIRKLDVSF